MRRVFLLLSLLALAAGASAGQRYAPVPGGFAITNGSARYSRPLYGWHGDDAMKEPRKSLFWTGDRPDVRLSSHPCQDPKAIPHHGALRCSPSDSSKTNCVFRYVYGRAEYDFGDGGKLILARAADNDGLFVESRGAFDFAADGEYVLADETTEDGAGYRLWIRKGYKLPPAARKGRAGFVAATNRLERLARTIEVRTPSPLLDSLVPCALVAADALLEDRIVCHGATGWHCAFAGWRGAYAFVSAGWDEAFKANARLYFGSQKPDGRIMCTPWCDSIYNMNEVFVDAVLRYWLRSGDDAFLRDCAYEGVKRHLAWMEATMKDPTTGLFENWLDAWNTDNKWCNGGAGTIATAYARFAYATMAKAARRLGKTDDAEAFEKRRDEIDRLAVRSLFSAEKGVWAEYRERFGHRTLLDCPDLSSVYTAIDCGLGGDENLSRRSLRWVEREIPSCFSSDGRVFQYSSNKLPKFYSSCGLYAQENLHLALAYQLVGESESGWRHLLSCIEPAAIGVEAGPGALKLQLDENLRNVGHVDFGDTVGVFLRTVVDGLFGYRGGNVFEPAFPSDWQAASIRTPYAQFDWTRGEGTASRSGSVRARPAKPHADWGHPRGEGTDLTLPENARLEPVDLARHFNQNLRLLHAKTYSPQIEPLRFADWSVPRTLTEHGRAWWEALQGVGDVHNERGGHNIPEKLSLPEAPNAVFTSLYDQFPDKATIPLSGRARKILVDVALSTNPNHDWSTVAVLTVRTTDGAIRTLALVPPDNCDDWLNYLQLRPYALKGNPIMLGERAHANRLAVELDPEAELESLTLETVATETLCGILSATLVR